MVTFNVRERNIKIANSVTILVFQNPPWQIIKTNENKTSIEFSGLVFDIVKELARNLNFTFTIQVIKNVQGANWKIKGNTSEKSNFGVTNVVTNKIPESVIDLIRTKTVALAICAFTVTEQEKMFINFTEPVSTQSYTFLVARPKELSRALLFMSPFNKDVRLLNLF